MECLSILLTAESQGFKGWECVKPLKDHVPVLERSVANVDLTWLQIQVTDKSFLAVFFDLNPVQQHSDQFPYQAI